MTQNPKTIMAGLPRGLSQKGSVVCPHCGKSHELIITVTEAKLVVAQPIIGRRGNIEGYAKMPKLSPRRF